MGMAVDDAVDAVAGKCRFHRGRRGVGDRFHLALCLQSRLVRLAGGARLLGECQARGQRLGQEACLPRRIAGLDAELLVGDVVGAQQVAVHQQDRFAVEHHHRRVGQDRHARATCICLAEQEIAVAADEMHPHAGIAQAVQPVGHERAGVGRIVIADPGLEQVAEDVQRIGLAGFAIHEAPEQFGDRRPLRVQVQVGNEKRGHAPLCTGGRW